MVETISPVVYGGRGRWAVALGFHAAGATIVGAAFGAALGWLGSALGAPFGRTGWVLLAVASAVYALGAAGVAPVPVPALRRQVPDWWRTFFPPMVAAFLYGAGLGVGFLTFLVTGALVVVGVGAVLSGSVLTGAVLFGAFGAARAASAVRAVNVRSMQDGRDLVERLATRTDRWRRGAVSIVLLATAGAALVYEDARTRETAVLATAVLAVTFGWAGIAKTVANARWRRALVAHDLPGWLQRRAARGVPAAEALVPALVVMGYPRAAGWAAAALLTVFAGTIVRGWVRRGAAMACGCFGGRRERPAWVLLARVGGLAVLAALTVTGPAGEPVLQWPGVPAPSDLVPAVLATVGLITAGVLAWEGTRWLGGQT